MPGPARSLRAFMFAVAVLPWVPAALANPMDDGRDGARGGGHEMTMGDHGKDGPLMGHGAQQFYMYPGPMTPNAAPKRSRVHYEIPHVTLYNEDGAAVELDRLLHRPGPVALQFIFTSCATICPVLSAGFSQAQAALLARDPSTRLISISIDPEYDTPARLRTYAERYHAGRNWIFLTGRLGDIRTVIEAFDALYRAGSKMYHRPYTYFRGRPGDDWVRLDGLLSEADLVREFDAVLAADAKETHRAAAEPR